METNIIPGIELTVAEMCEIFEGCSITRLKNYESILKRGYKQDLPEFFRYHETGKKFESEYRSPVIEVSAPYGWAKTRDGEISANIKIINTIESKSFNDPIFIVTEVKGV